MITAQKAATSRRPGPLAAVLLLALATALPGCVSHVRYVDIDSKPTGATIYVNGEKKGVTRSSRLELDFTRYRDGRILIQLVKPRYRPIFQYWTIGEVPEKKVFPLEVD